MAHFPIKKYYNFHFSTTPKNHFFLQYLIPVFLLDFVQHLSSLKIATLPTGNIKVPIVNEKAEYYQVQEINSLVHNVAHTYHLEITERIGPTNYAPRYNEYT